MIRCKSNDSRPEFQQLQTIRLFPMLDGKYEVRTRANNWKAGTLDLKESVFTSAPRTEKNLFLAFGSPCLGVNAELLEKFEFDLVRVPYENSMLTTTRARWLEQGIKSPFEDKRIDRQLLLWLDAITFEEGSNSHVTIPQQPSLFESEVN